MTDLDALARRMARHRPASVSAPGREAAVLIPLYREGDRIFVVFTQRSDDVPRHAGQISFPGGGREPGDATLWDTALREAEEEIALSAADVRRIGQLDAMVTVSDYRVSPFVGIVTPRSALVPDGREIASIIHVPLTHLQDPGHHSVREVKLPGRTRTVHVFEFGPHVIWGATARILKNLLDVIQRE